MFCLIPVVFQIAKCIFFRTAPTAAVNGRGILIVAGGLFVGLWRRMEPVHSPLGRILSMTRERWAQIGITIQFLIVVRTLGEIFRLRHVQGADFSAAIAMQYLGGDLIAVCSCWLGVTLYFFRRYTLSAWITLTTVAILLVYKIALIG